MSTYEDSFEGSDASSSHSSPPGLRATHKNEPDTAEPLSLLSLPSVPIPVPVQQELQSENSRVTIPAAAEEEKKDDVDTNANTDTNADAALITLVPPATPPTTSDILLPKAELKSPAVGEATPTPTPRDTVSLETTYSNIERKLDGINAVDNEQFQALTSYVAFGATPPRSAGDPSVSLASTKGGGVGSDVNSVAGDVVGKTSPAAIVPVVTREEKQHSWMESSVFSTLSQHLSKAEPHGDESNAAVPLKEAAATAAAAVASSLTAKEKNTNDEGGGGVSLVTSSPLRFPPPAHFKPQLAVPVSISLNSKDPLSPPSAPNRFETVLASLPPPLPSRDPQQDPKIVELRETSEAVERLVRAFALLRGHVAADSTDPLADAKASYATKDMEGLSSLRRQHRVGDAGTMRMFDVNRRVPVMPRPKYINDTQDENEKAALQQNEAAVEDAIMCLIMEIMQRDAKQPFEENIDKKVIQPSFEVVEMENFKSALPSKPRKSHRSLRKVVTPFSVFDGGMQAFAPGDADASESLYNSVLQGLQKYVWSHVAASTRHANSHFPPVSAHFAWTLQLDLLLVCMQILESRFAGERGGTKDGAAVWIQYEGPREAEPFARNAAHCLPFEALDVKRREKPLFRLEFWVTKEKMWTVAEALIASIREGIVLRSDGYRAFSSDDEIHIDPNALLPTRVPLFSLVAPERLGTVDEDGRHNLKKGPIENEKEESNANFFQIQPKTLESLAHAVSTAGTELLEADNRPAGKKNTYRQRYQDATTAVTEAVCELLKDTGIRAAVQRRATAKLTELAKRREEDNNLSRQEKERLLIETAEEEAERVVQKIMQEMRVEEAENN